LGSQNSISPKPPCIHQEGGGTVEQLSQFENKKRVFCRLSLISEANYFIGQSMETREVLESYRANRKDSTENQSWSPRTQLYVHPFQLVPVMTLFPSDKKQWTFPTSDPPWERLDYVPAKTGRVARTNLVCMFTIAPSLDESLSLSIVPMGSIPFEKSSAILSHSRYSIATRALRQRHHAVAAYSTKG
jgi:hypothetical protein